MKKYIVLALVAAFLVVGCKTPNWLITNDFHDDNRVVKEYLTPATQVGSESDEYFLNYSIRVCNVDDNGNYSQCMDTLVIENIVSDSAYGYYGNHR